MVLRGWIKGANCSYGVIVLLMYALSNYLKGEKVFFVCFPVLGGRGMMVNVVCGFRV